MSDSTPITILDGRFVLHERIGKGGVGEVWRAHHRPRNREVALKLLREELSANPSLRRRFAREARAASSLDHPNIAAVYDFGADTEGHLYIAMENVVGPSLAHAIEIGLCYRDVLELADQLLAGLAHAHARGVIHRDLKPDNVLLGAGELPGVLGTPKIVDFGIATITADGAPGDDRDTIHGEVVGTPRYMSPEQATGERNLGPRTDLYNVGLILYELVAGTPPFGADRGLAVMSRHVHEPIPPMIPRPGLSVDMEFGGIVMRALEKKALDRWASAAEMRKALEPLLLDAREDPEATQRPQPLASWAPRDEAAPTPVEGSDRQEERDLRSTAPDLPRDLGEAGGTEPEELHEPPFTPWNVRIPFVGRDEERRRLVELVTRAVEQGQGSIVLVEGEAGVGKTRLTEWLREHVEELGQMRANGGSFSRGVSSGLRGVQEVLESMFRTRGLSRARVARKVEGRLREWEHDWPEDAAQITDFIRPTAGDDDTRPLNLSTAALFATVARVLEYGARQTPRLIILDDIHWAGRELADFLDYLAVEMRHRRFPLVVVATIRSEDLAERPDLESKLGALSRYVGETVERMQLERLAPGLGRELVHALLPSDEELVDIILARSSGNPLHLLLLLRYLRQEGLLQWHEDRWHAVDIGQIAGAVPPSLGDLFRGRIEQAEAHYNIEGRLRRLLQYAAIAGMRFQYEVLRQMVSSGGDADLGEPFDHDLDRLLAEGFLVEVQGRGDDWYGFTHGLLRDYLLHDIGPVRARRLHGIAASAMVEVFGGQADPFAFEIAAHYDDARRSDEALVWYRRAAEAARRSFSLRQAAASYEAGLAIMDDRLGVEASTLEPLGPGLDPQAFENAGVPTAAYLETLSRLGDLNEGFGDYPTAEIYYRRVVRLVGRDTQRLHADVASALGYSWLGLGHVAWQRGDFEAAEWAFKKVRELARRHPAHQLLREDATRGLARVAWHRGEYASAGELAQAALEAAETHDNSTGAAESLWILGEINRMLGHASKARAFYRRSLQIVHEGGLPTGIARNLLSLAQLARYQKDFRAARELYQKALEHYENLGDRRSSGHCHNGLGDVARLEARYADADEAYARALEIYEGIGAEYDVAIVLANLGLNSIALADFTAAEESLEIALSIVRAGDFPYLMAGIEYNLALVKARLGDEEDTRELIGRIFDWSERVAIADIDYAAPLEQLAALRAEAGSWEDAHALWEKALVIYEGLGLEDDRARVSAYLARVDD